jgi:hypothetical protein
LENSFLRRFVSNSPTFAFSANGGKFGCDNPWCPSCANLGMVWGEKAETGVKFLQAFSSSSDHLQINVICETAPAVRQGNNQKRALAPWLMHE